MLSLCFAAPALLPASVPARAPSPVMSAERSASIPFLKKPPALDGSMIGDVGFDPLGFSTTITELGGDLRYVRLAVPLQIVGVYGLPWRAIPGSRPLLARCPWGLESMVRAGWSASATSSHVVHPSLRNLKVREAELMHGRVAMLAAVGMVFPKVFGKLPAPWAASVSTNPLEAQYQVSI
jgi:hypothetical protein